MAACLARADAGIVSRSIEDAQQVVTPASSPSGRRYVLGNPEPT
jgi:hypothetical protein